MRRRDDLVSYRHQYEFNLDHSAAEVEAATIAVETAHAGIILVAGADDALWPSDRFARSIADRLEAARKSVTLLIHPGAGHRVLLPTETTPRSSLHAHGGSDQADRELGEWAWDAILEGMFP